MERNPQHFGNQFLGFAGMLVGRVNDDAFVFGWLYQTGLPFQIEVLLTADELLAFDHLGGVGQSLFPVTTLLHVGGANEFATLGSSDRVKGGRLLVDFGDSGGQRLLYGFPRGAVALGSDGKQRLTDKADFAIDEDRVAGEDRADIGMAGHVSKADRIDDTRQAANCLEVEPRQPAMGYGRESQSDVDG